MAVQTYAHELGLPLMRDLTVTGGMHFASGPYNNHVLQAACRMARLLREGRGRHGLVSSVSGILTKQGFGLCGRAPAPQGFTQADLTRLTAQRQTQKQVHETHRGAGRVAGFTGVHEHSSPRPAVVLHHPCGDRARQRHRSRRGEDRAGG